jgi:hypothetical protein
MSPVTPDQAAQVLALWEEADLYEDLFWRVTRTPQGLGLHKTEVRLFAQCSDLFYWATADLEEIVPEDLPLLRSTLDDLKLVGATYYLNELFSCRKRKLRPQKPWYKHFEAGPGALPAQPEVAALFDECCTEQEREKADQVDAAWWVGLARWAKRR